MASDLEALLQDLEHPNWLTRRQAAIELGNMGAAARDAVPSLIDVLYD